MRHTLRSLRHPKIHSSPEYHGTSMMVRQWYRPSQEDGYDQETDERLDIVVRESTDHVEIIRRRLKATRMYFTRTASKHVHTSATVWTRRISL